MARFIHDFLSWISPLFIHPRAKVNQGLTDLQVFAATLLGESESLGMMGMEGTALTIINRAKADLLWMGGNTIRGVCLQPRQYSFWNGGGDLGRVLHIVNDNPLYGGYVQALHIASDGINGNLQDWTNGAVSYFDPPANPTWAKDKIPCLIDGKRKYYDLKAILA